MKNIGKKRNFASKTVMPMSEINSVISKQNETLGDRGVTSNLVSFFRKAHLALWHLHVGTGEEIFCLRLKVKNTLKITSWTSKLFPLFGKSLYPGPATVVEEHK